MQKQILLLFFLILLEAPPAEAATWGAANAGHGSSNPDKAWPGGREGFLTEAVAVDSTGGLEWDGADPIQVDKDPDDYLPRPLNVAAAETIDLLAGPGTAPDGSSSPTPCHLAGARTTSLPVPPALLLLGSAVLGLAGLKKKLLA